MNRVNAKSNQTDLISKSISVDYLSPEQAATILNTWFWEAFIIATVVILLIGIPIFAMYWYCNKETGLKDKINQTYEKIKSRQAKAD